ncbi:ADP-ribosylglycohydrolase family protein [Streptomyces globisporus]|uniref:ADP-ribosylglycohydrolase family protein n=1 Tax=Streptomyces globisporus TaxID=1908 RepID=UPI0037B42062
MTTKIAYRIINSARWAAYGDALGFISELTDSKGLLRRLRSDVALDASTGTIPWAKTPLENWPLQCTVEWRRRVGGRQGVPATLLAGTYSDDTQLRLATSRSLRPAEGFDLETFAKVELPVWQSYALGAGRASKAAASSLARGKAWLANSYQGWTDAGGNGVIVRVQPHAWESVAAGRSPYLVLMEVLKNGLSTHGHPRALVPACAYADLLMQILRKEIKELRPRDLYYSIEHASRLVDFIQEDRDLATFTIPEWERVSGRSFIESWHEVTKEMMLDVNTLTEQLASAAASSDVERVDQYLSLLSHWELFSDERRGSGTGTLMAAFALVLLFENDPRAAVLAAAGAMGSDTDSIASVLGGIVGALMDHPEDIPGPLLDEKYIVSEALRVSGLSDESANTFSYPDLLHWDPPRTQADAVIESEGQAYVMGLGRVKTMGPEFSSPTPFSWQWLHLDMGQTILAKKRSDLKSIPVSALPKVIGSPVAPSQATISRGPAAKIGDSVPRGDEGIAARLKKATGNRRMRVESFHQEALLEVSSNSRKPRATLSLEDAFNEARESGYDESVIGRLLVRLSHEQSVEVAVVFSGLVARDVRSLRAGGTS